jgi:hypothetical protein
LLFILLYFHKYGNVVKRQAVSKSLQRINLIKQSGEQRLFLTIWTSRHSPIGLVFDE